MGRHGIADPSSALDSALPGRVPLGWSLLSRRQGEHSESAFSPAFDHYFFDSLLANRIAVVLFPLQIEGFSHGGDSRGSADSDFVTIGGVSRMSLFAGKTCLFYGLQRVDITFNRESL